MILDTESYVLSKNNYIEVKDKDASKIYYKINENK